MDVMGGHWWREKLSRDANCIWVPTTTKKILLSHLCCFYSNTWRNGYSECCRTTRLETASVSETVCNLIVMKCKAAIGETASHMRRCVAMTMWTLLLLDHLLFSWEIIISSGRGWWWWPQGIQWENLKIYVTVLIYNCFLLLTIQKPVSWH